MKFCTFTCIYLVVVHSYSSFFYPVCQILYFYYDSYDKYNCWSTGLKQYLNSTWYNCEKCSVVVNCYTHINCEQAKSLYNYIMLQNLLTVCFLLLLSKIYSCLNLCQMLAIWLLEEVTVLLEFIISYCYAYGCNVTLIHSHKYCSSA